MAILPYMKLAGHNYQKVKDLFFVETLVPGIQNLGSSLKWDSADIYTPLGKFQSNI